MAASKGSNPTRKPQKIDDPNPNPPRWNKSAWVKLVKSQNDYMCARLLWERALEVDRNDHTLWLMYAELEKKNNNFNRARYVLDRAVQYLFMVDELRYNYIHMEEITLGDVPRARLIFERWMRRMPAQHVWLSYIEFELRYNELDRARAVFNRFVQCHPTVTVWIRFAKFEMRIGEVARARNCYERAVDKLAHDKEEAEELFMAFAEFEDKYCKETERARRVYKSGLDLIPQGQDLYWQFVAFEYRQGIDQDVVDIVGKIIFQYEDELRKNPSNYETWFDYIRLEENIGNKERIRQVYERAIANVPPAQEKRYWKRYIYLWINYALYEELGAKDMERTREVYRECLKLIPHQKFSFAKIWLLAAMFEYRHLKLGEARLILGEAIGVAPKDKIFKKYIEIELHLGNIEHCRELYEKYLEFSPENCDAWIKFTELERSLYETHRARAIFERAIRQPALDMPELLWEAYIDFEISEGDFERTRAVYERILNHTKLLKFWILYAKFEASARVVHMRNLDVDRVVEEQERCLQRARGVFERALTYLRTSSPELIEERAMLLKEWLDVESRFGELGDVNLVHVEIENLEDEANRDTEDDGLLL